MTKKTNEIEETVLVRDAADFRQLFEELLADFETNASYPEAVTLSVEWEESDEEGPSNV